jgi:hypothetical protein
MFRPIDTLSMLVKSAFGRSLKSALDLIRNPQDPNNLPKVAGYWLHVVNGFGAILVACRSGATRSSSRRTRKRYLA